MMRDRIGIDPPVLATPASRIRARGSSGTAGRRVLKIPQRVQRWTSRRRSAHPPRKARSRVGCGSGTLWRAHHEALLKISADEGGAVGPEVTRQCFASATWAVFPRIWRTPSTTSDSPWI